MDCVIEANGFAVERGAATVVFLNISRLNHSCAANAYFHWDSARFEGTVVVKRPVPAGAEVTINYGAQGTRAERQWHLRERFGFDCGCERCALEQMRVSGLMSWPPIRELATRWQRVCAIAKNIV